MKATSSQIKGMIDTFLADPAVAAAERTVPAALRDELNGHSTEYLLGYIEGVSRTISTLQKVDMALTQGAAGKAMAQRTMLSVTVLIGAQELMRREEVKRETASRPSSTGSSGVPEVQAER